MTPPPSPQLVRAVVWEPLAAGAAGSPERGLAPRGAEGPADAVEELYTRLLRFIGTVRDHITADTFPWGALDRLIQDVSGTLAKSDDLFWIANRVTAPPGVDYLAFHQARVAVLALRIGASLGYEPRRLGELGMAACLFDAGLWQMPEAVMRQADPLSAREQELYRGHPRLGAALVRRWDPPSEVIVDAVLQHHEREQGQGYPQGMRGPAIHPDAKIIGLADTYAMLTLPPAPRLGRPAHDAVREIVRSRHRAFDPVLIKALLHETSLFPPGTLVRVSNGEIGRVIALNRNHPLRPRVELLGRPSVAPRIIDLVESPFLYITGPISK
jgi:HD-GYP domain-containing protein (c-di-GMP phosphodiesterase class II)